MTEETFELPQESDFLSEGGQSAPSEIEKTPFIARVKSFTRRGRELNPGIQRTWDAYADQYVIDVPRAEGYTTVSDGFRLDLEATFGRVAPLVVEIGPGNGEQIVAYAKAHPEMDFLAFEVYRQGIGKTIARAVAAGVTNLRLVEADAAQALPIMLADGVATEVWVFFPDPWRKARHHKRRLVSPTFALEVARLLKDEGIWRMATDWQNYAWQMRDVLEGCDQFLNPYLGERPDPEEPEPTRGGYAPRFEGRVKTHFENRGDRQGRESYDIVGIRRSREN